MKRVLLFAASLLVSLSVFAAKPASTVQVVEAWARATPAVAPVAAGYLTLVNHANAPDRLLRVDSTVAKRVEIHMMRNDGGIMRMRQITDGLVIPAHGTLQLQPGGDHLMLIDPAHALIAGDHFEATLVLQRAGALKVTFEVRPMDAGTHAHSH